MQPISLPKLIVGDFTLNENCRKWSLKEFVIELGKSLGIEAHKFYNSTTDKMLNTIIEFFEQRAHDFPQLIIDQANDLRSAALPYFIIPLFSRLEGKMSVVVLGTEALKQSILRGVRLNVSGFDELHSRLGRSFVTLIGNTRSDVTKIANVNDIEDKKVINDIWKECNPFSKVVHQGKKKVTIQVVTDTRRLRRCIEREQLKKAAMIKQIDVEGAEEVTGKEVSEHV